MVNIFFPVFDLINGLLGKIFPFVLQNLIWGIIAGSLAFIVYWLLSNQTQINVIKEEIKTIRKKMFAQDLDDKSEYNKLAKRNLSLSFKLLKNIFIPAIVSILPVIIIALWYDINASYSFPVDGQHVLVRCLPDSTALNIDPVDISSKDISGNIYLHSFGKNQIISIFNSNELIYKDRLFSKPIPVITKKKWWNIFISSPVGYLISDSAIEAVIFDYPEYIQFKKMPEIINGWELLFFVGIFISALPLRIFFKVH